MGGDLGKLHRCTIPNRGGNGRRRVCGEHHKSLTEAQVCWTPTSLAPNLLRNRDGPQLIISLPQFTVELDHTILEVQVRQARKKRGVDEKIEYTEEQEKADLGLGKLRHHRLIRICWIITARIGARTTGPCLNPCYIHL